MFAFLCLILFLIILKIYLFKRQRQHMVQLIEKIPGPNGYPLIGNVLTFFSTPRHGESNFNLFLVQVIKKICWWLLIFKNYFWKFIPSFKNNFNSFKKLYILFYVDCNRVDWDTEYNTFSKLNVKFILIISGIPKNSFYIIIIIFINSFYLPQFTKLFIIY